MITYVKQNLILVGRCGYRERLQKKDRRTYMHNNPRCALSQAILHLESESKDIWQNILF